MKQTENVEIYYCDCCGERMFTQPPKMLKGCNRNSKGVCYEPKVMGDYCGECLQIAQDDWDLNNKNGFVSERYDSYDKAIHNNEISEMQKHDKGNY